MKRHVALEPFSRDHNEALILARSLREERDGAVQAFERLWKTELQDHFEQEELLLGQLLDSENLNQLRTEHDLIRQLQQKLPEGSAELGLKLESHVRWEERHLFPWIETHASNDQMDALQLKTDLVEQRRGDASPRRKELVERRHSAKG